MTVLRSGVVGVNLPNEHWLLQRRHHLVILIIRQINLLDTFSRHRDQLLARHLRHPNVLYFIIFLTVDLHQNLGVFLDFTDWV